MPTAITPADVLEQTGISVETPVIALAWGTIESFTGRMLVGADAPVLAIDDETWVRRAAIYQAVWLNAQADTFERVDVEMLTHDEMTVRPRDGYSFVLAPMARLALVNCSWAVGGELNGTATGGPGGARRKGFGSVVLESGGS